MRRLRILWDEIVGLFVDDRLYAIAILAWIALVWFMVTRVGIASVWGAVALFAGLALILVENTTRAARR